MVDGSSQFLVGKRVSVETGHRGFLWNPFSRVT